MAGLSVVIASRINLKCLEKFLGFSVTKYVAELFVDHIVSALLAL